MSSCCAVKPGFKSSVTFASARFSGRWQDIVSVSGPEMPKCVNSISPKSEYSTFLPFFSVSATFFSASPCKRPHQSQSVSIADSTPMRGVVVCPTLSASR